MVARRLPLDLEAHERRPDTCLDRGSNALDA
jgi:hypothetical protein